VRAFGSAEDLAAHDPHGVEEVPTP
jgi:hypothetical protein